jgi:hypothetical protein
MGGRTHVVGIGLLIGGLAAGAAAQAVRAQQAGARREACELLAADEIRTVQDATLEKRKGSEGQSRALHFSQCFFATNDVARSVSLTVITGDGVNPAGDAARDYWQSTFHQRQKDAAGAEASARETEEQESLPRAIPGAGEEAFWTGDARAGALYVLSDRVVLRISVGGVTDEGERIRRSKALARAALDRLRRNR